eukprot:2723236-Rhodomonas_salina.1
MSGTDIAYAAQGDLRRERAQAGTMLRPCYAMPSTVLAYGATRLLCDVRYCTSVWCYAIRGTYIAHGATRLLCDVGY